MTTSTATGALAAGLALSAILALHGGAADAEPPGRPSAAVSTATDTVPATGTAPTNARAPAGVPAATAVGVHYEWPTGDEVPVVRDFDRPEVPWASGHRGVDLGLAAGTAVRAAADGVVAFAGVVVDRPVVSVQHADGIRTTYEPVAPLVTRGEPVRAGQVLGRLTGGDHCGASTCLHWGARRGDDDYLDPLSLLRSHVVIRLLPG